MAKKASILHNKTWNMFGGVHCYWWRSVYVLAKVRLYRKKSDSHLIITRVSNKLQIFSSEFIGITNGIIFVFFKENKTKVQIFPPIKEDPTTTTTSTTTMDCGFQRYHPLRAARSMMVCQFFYDLS